MLDTEIDRLIRLLIKRTSNSKLRWSTRQSNSAFSAKIGGQQITVSAVGAASLFPSYYLQVKDEQGEVIEQISWTGMERRPYEDLGRLYFFARRRAHNIEQKVDHLFDELDG